MIRHFELPLAHGITLACRAVDAESAAPRIVLLHGFPEAAFVWDGLMQGLAGRARCWAPNLRGYAGSSAPHEVSAYRARHLVADVAAVIEALGAPVDLLVAHDWGGALAWNLAATRPELMKRLLIINSPHPATFLRELRDNPAQQVASAYMNALCLPDAEERLRADGFAPLWRFFGQPAWLTPERRAAYEAAWTQGLAGPLNYYRASPLRPPESAADAIHSLQLPREMVTVRVPTTVLWGEADVALLPGLLDGLASWVPDLDLRRVPEASHWLLHEHPDRVGRLIEELLAPDEGLTLESPP